MDVNRKPNTAALVSMIYIFLATKLINTPCVKSVLETYPVRSPAINPPIIPVMVDIITKIGTIVMAAANFATAIIIEAGLSFLGLGIQPPHPSWGLMIKENYNFVITNNPMLALAPGIAIMLMVLAFNLLGNALSDAMDVKSL